MKYVLFVCLWPVVLLWGQTMERRIHNTSYTFVENKGQWPKNISYAAEIPNGKLYLHKNSITYTFFENDENSHLHTSKPESLQNQDGLKTKPTRSSDYTVHFLNSQESTYQEGIKPLITKYNYIKGPDPSAWSIGAKSYKEIKYHQIYPNVDLELKQNEGILKYEFVLQKGADLKQIKLEYEGTEGVSLEKGHLLIKTSLGVVIEQKPYCYQRINGLKKEIKSKYVLKKNILSFKLLESYEPEYPLVIDPEIVFSTYSGSVFDNFGNTATYDKEGNLYSGGIVFNRRFPTKEADIDILIYKYNKTGTQAEYITYLGGDSIEVPHSLLVNDKNELIILGITGSGNAPTSANAYDRSFKGGPKVYPLGGIYFKGGSDLYIAKLSPSGTLVAATYLGGTGNDGINVYMNSNYGDIFRGDIATDVQGNICISSNTSSSDFPIVNGFSTAYAGGGSDGLVCKLSDDLGSLRWSSLLGGAGADAVYSIKASKSGEVFVAGGTDSYNFPTSATALHPTLQGDNDGFVSRISADGSTVLAATYLGTSSHEQAYFVQLDSDEEVYVLGQTKGAYPVMGAAYSNPGSGQFIQKITKDLSTSLLSTVFGSGSGSPDISLTAFLVNDCDKIYVTGWGGDVNAGYMDGNTSGLPVTADAFQSSTDSSDFYLCVFDKDMSSLVYATFLGGNDDDPRYIHASGEHVDGGTSRFDPKGIVYHAVCSCGEVDYPTYPAGVWSSTNNAPIKRYRIDGEIVYIKECNNAAFKFDLFEIDAEVKADDTLGCSPFKVNYTNHSKGGTTYTWYINGVPIQTTADTSIGLSYTYTKAGVYKLMLVANNRATCKINDTDYVSIVVDTVLSKVTPPDPICFGKTRAMLAKIDSSASNSFVWHPGKYLSDSTIANPIASPPVTTLFKVLSTNENGCSKLDSVILKVHPLPLVHAGNDTTICYGNKVKLNASGASGYYWTPSDSVDNPYVAHTHAGPYADADFFVEGTDVNGCKAKDTLKVKVTYLPIQLQDTTICKGTSLVLKPLVPTAISYKWSPSTYLSQNNILNPISTPSSPIRYGLSITDALGCKSSGRDSISISLREAILHMPHDTLLCRTIPMTIKVTGAVQYVWNRTAPELVCLQPDCETVNLTPSDSIRWYVVRATDKYGCKAKDSIRTLFRPVIVPEVDFSFESPRCLTGPSMFKAEIIKLDTVCSIPNWLWDFGDQTTDTVRNPIHKYQKPGVYPVTLSLNGSKSVLKVLNILAEDSCLKNIYIPNTFTPNGDGINDILYVRGVNIVKVHFHLYNNLGERVFYTENLHAGWDGIYKGDKQTSQVFVYHCDATFWDGSTVHKEGNVTLLE